MPLSPLPTETEEQLEKAQGVRKKIMDNFINKYLFRFEPCWAPVDKVVVEDQLHGMVFQKTKIENGKVVSIEDQFEEFTSPVGNQFNWKFAGKNIWYSRSRFHIRS